MSATETDSAETGTVLERVARASNLSKAESAVAGWLETQLMTVPFDTAGDLAGHAGVSEMSVTRFVRRLGYRNFKAYKAAVNADLRDGAAPRKVLQRARVAIPGTGGDALDEQLQMELDAIVDVYRLARTRQWAAAVEVIHGARHVNICGFQGSQGLAMDFATRLKYARPGVRFATGLSGNWSELFAEEPESSCVVLVDTVPYAEVSLKIAELCLRRGIPPGHGDRPLSPLAAAIHAARVEREHGDQDLPGLDRRAVGAAGASAERGDRADGAGGQGAAGRDERAGAAFRRLHVRAGQPGAARGGGAGQRERGRRR